MRGTVVMASRAVGEGRNVLWAALAAGVLPFASPLFPGVGSDRAIEARDAMALILCLAFGLGVAFAQGATAVGRDLAERRLAFDFARPVSGVAIWAGRFLGALALALLAMALAVLPATLAGGGIFSSSLRHLIPQAGLAALVAILGLLPLVHAASLAFRSRTRWLAFDLMAAAVALVLVASGVLRLIDLWAFGMLTTTLAAAIGVLIPSLWIASAVQVMAGRTDIRRGHGLLSLTMWGLLLPGALACEVGTRWVAAATPDDLVGYDCTPARTGNWTEVWGEARWRGDYAPGFLMDTASGRSLPLGPAGLVELDSEVSADGSRAIWLRAAGLQPQRLDLFSADLSAAHPVPVETNFSFDRGALRVLSLSADGGRLAVVEGQRLSVHDLVTGSILTVRTLPSPTDPPTWYQVAFRKPGLVRVYEEAVPLLVHEVDVEEDTVRSFAVEEETPGLSWDAWLPGHERLLAMRIGEPQTAVFVDGKTGRILARIEQGEEMREVSASLLADGGVAFAAAERQGRAWIRIHEPDGAPKKLIDLGPQGGVFLRGEIEPGRLVLAAGSQPERLMGEGAILLVDTATGEVSKVAHGPAPFRFWSVLQRIGGPGTPGGALLFSNPEAVVRLDPRTGEQRLVAGRLPGS